MAGIIALAIGGLCLASACVLTAIGIRYILTGRRNR